jgi:hypothetical protein
VLVPSWDGDDEVTWAQQRVAAALATFSEVHLIYPDSQIPVALDLPSVTHHQLGPGLDQRAALRRDLLVATFSSPTVGYAFARSDPEIQGAEAIDSLLPMNQAQWEQAGELIGSLQPDLIVVCDHRDVGVMKALRAVPDCPVALVPLVDTAATPDRAHYDPLFARADRVIVFSQAEQHQVRSRSNKPIGRAELPVDIDATLPPRSDGSTADPPYVMVLVAAGERDRLGLRPFADLIGLANPTVDVVIASGRSTVRWRAGHRASSPTPVTDEDVRLLMAGAAVLVDLHPGRLVARRCIEALRLGTPIVVPSGSRAAVLCHDAHGGLTYGNAGELLGAVESLLDPKRAETLAREGRTYADEHHGSPDRFARQLTAALGLPEVGATRIA